MAEDTKNRFTVWSAEWRQNPHPLYAQMREEAPIYHAVGPVSGHDFWFMTRYDDCVRVLRDDRFIKDSDKVLSDEQRARFGQPDPVFAAINRHMLNLDPPDHTRLRSLVHKAFTPRMVENMRAHIEEIADSLLVSIKQSGDSQIDLIKRFALPLPITVIAELLGIPKDDQEMFRAWIQALLFGTDPDKTVPAAMAVMSYFNEIFDARRADPQDDLISALLHVEESGDVLNHEELIGMIFLLLVAGHETTVNLIGNGMLALMQHRDQQAALVENPALIKTAVEEMLRYHGPVENTLSRWAADDIEWGGQVIKKGQTVFATLMAANRDPSAFPDPDRFDITRDPNKHIAFGGGIHYCLGAPLARMEGAVAINALLRHYPNIQLAVSPDEIQYPDQILLRGALAIPVRL